MAEEAAEATADSSALNSLKCEEETSGGAEPEGPGGLMGPLPDDVKGRGVVYVAQLPHGWTRVQVIRYFEKFGEVTRVFLNRRETRGNRNGRGFIFTDGWIEYRKKRKAKQVVTMMHGQPIGGKKRNKHAQDLLMLSYLKGFDFGSLYEDAMHVKRTRQDRLNAQMARVKKESKAYIELLEQKHSVEQLKLRLNKKKEREAAEEADLSSNADFAFAATKLSTRKRQINIKEAQAGIKRTKTQEPVGSASVSRSILKMLAA